MRSTWIKWLSHRAVLLIPGVVGLLAIPTESQGQNLFDPYQPYASSNNSSTYPTLPNNLALPGQARDASEYFRGPAVSRYNTFERYLNGDDGLGSGTQGGIGVPYFEAARPADREFQAFAAKRNRLYTSAMNEKDPARRAKLLREVGRMRSPRESASRNSLPTKAATARSTVERNGRTTRSSRNEALAAEALNAPRASDPSGSRIPATTAPRPRSAAREVNDAANAANDPKAAESQRIRRLQAPDRRPRLPSEIPADPAR